MRKRILLLHGWGGSDHPHWQSWLAAEIAKEYGAISFLKFSNFEEPNLNIWKIELKNELEKFKPNIVICHSLANTLWFHLCNEGEIQEVKKLYLVAPPSMNCKVEELKSFFPVKIPRNLRAKETLLVTSTNDPYLSVDEANELQKKLAIPMEMLKNAGHINTDSGFGKWPWILKKIKGENE